jgi:threonine dehydratase
MNAPAADAELVVRDVYEAAQRIAGSIRRTPLATSEALGRRCGADILLKLECWQRTGSFKVRGAFNAVATLSAEQRARGLVTASAGNHGQAVALAAREHGVAATIFVPADAPETKCRRIEHFGAVLRREAADYDEAEAVAIEHARSTGAHFVHAYSAAAVVAGQGTVALEIAAERPDVAQVLVPVGGGGLISGVGLVLKAVLPGVRVTGVQSTRTRAMYEAFRAGHLVDVPVPPTLADGLAGCTDERAYALARPVVDDIVLVEESEIGAAIRWLYEHDGVVAEGAGAVGAAALLSGRVEPIGPTVVFITGGNIDGQRLAGILEQAT